MDPFIVGMSITIFPALSRMRNFLTAPYEMANTPMGERSFSLSLCFPMLSVPS